MKAARLHEGETAVRIEEVDTPEVQPGTVLVGVQTVFLSPFAAGLVDGSDEYLTPPRPFTPGMDAVGTVQLLGSDVTGLEAGQRVYCDCYYQSPTRGGGEDFGFIGNFGIGERSPEMLRRWHDGALAEQMLLPAECVIPIPEAVTVSDAILCRLGWLGTAYGAFTKVGLAPGEAVAVLGGTGLVGVSAVLVALAMGARSVFALGRRKDALEEIAGLNSRVQAGTTLPNGQTFDVVLSAIEARDASAIQAALTTLNRSGRLVAVGVTEEPLAVATDLIVGMDLTIRGSLWFERHQTVELLSMIAAGTLDLSTIEVDEYPLADVGEALDATRRRQGAFQQVVVRC
jgi:D-arabinose 1-dehydrogenase-like Zn-dependent alcohol dehydrogenase